MSSHRSNWISLYEYIDFVARRLWRDYFASGVDGVVFIVDAVDRERFPEAKKELDVRYNTDLLFSSLQINCS